MDKILILDFGSQYNQLISRRIREMDVYSEVIPFHSFPKIIDPDVKGIILSGGPESVYDKDAPYLDPSIFDWNIPVLGICYGMQLLMHHFGGIVEPTQKREYGKSEIKLAYRTLLFDHISSKSIVWMSHSDHVRKVPEGFKITSATDSSIASVEDQLGKIFGLQFHPEVSHTQEGDKILANFVLKICNAKQEWNVSDFIETSIHEIRKIVQDQHVILGLSGGVDSSVTAALLHKAIGSQLTCIFIDTGLLRKEEAKEVMNGYGNLPNLDIELIDAKDRFITVLKGITDPEQKRKIIGKTFFDVFEQAKASHLDAVFLAQGTIYPDVIESQSVHGPSATIKSHHNVGGVPEEHSFQLLEPLRMLFKDEVRRLGLALDLSRDLVMRHPFPGPGLGIRILGEITEEKVKILQDADSIFIEELRKNGYYDKVSQAFVTLLPVKTVGVMGDRRTYEYLSCLRSVNTTDFMTANTSDLPHWFLELVSTRIINEVNGINRVLYDITTKPPGTIEWE